MTLKKQAIHSVLWTFIDSFLVKGLSFVAGLILARLLGPSEFGLLGMISIFIAIGTSLVDSGLSSSLIRTKEADNTDYSTVFFTNLGMSLLIYGLLFVSAPYIADFYEQPILIGLIRLYCVGFVISALSAVQLTILIKAMKFKRITHFNIPSTLIGVGVGVGLGYMGYGVWSLVWMYLVTQACNSILFWSFSAWKPSLLISKEKLKYHYNFGYKLMLSGLLDQVFNNIYNVVIGKFFSAQSLGYYERAKTFNSYPSLMLSGIIGKVTYPLLAKIQDDSVRVAQVYRNILQVTFFVIAPVMLGAAAVAKPLFLLVLGVAWLPAVPFFQILSISFMLYPIHAFNINVLKVYGRSDLFLKLEIYKKIVVSISIIIAFQFGIYALVWSSVFTSLVALVINTHYSSQMISYTLKAQLLDMLPVFVITVIVFVVMQFGVQFLDLQPLIVQIFIPLLIGAVLYVGIHYMFKTKAIMYALTFIKNRNL